MLNISLEADKRPTEPLYMQLYGQIKREIKSGYFPPSSKLPSIRKLAEYLHLSRTTVEAAYQQLAAEGYINSAPKVGYYVSNVEHTRYEAEAGPYPLSKKVPEAEDHKPEYDFSSDSLDEDSFDFDLWRKYINKALKDKDRLLVYGSYQGETELRLQIARYVHNSRGVICHPDQVVIGAGVQSLLHILAGLLTPEYGAVGFEEPGFRQARHIFKDHGFEIIPVNLDEDGISVEDLAQSKAKAVYVSPSHQFPMGAAIPIGKRIQLLNWAHDQKGLIIEDDYDSELCYLGRPIPSLQGLNQGNSVVYLGTFSKIMLPSLRISYMILPPNLTGIYRQQGRIYNQTSSKIEQLALAAYIKDGRLEKQVRRLRKIYARKNQLLREAIEGIMGNKVRILGKEAGLHILLEVRTSLSPADLARLAEGGGVRVMPITSLFMEEKSRRAPLVLLAYGGIPANQIRPAVKALYKAWEKDLGHLRGEEE